MKKLIVNADDLGYSRGVNEGIIEAHKKGIVTSTTLMVGGTAAKEAVELIRLCPRLGVGLHFVLTDEEQKALRAIRKAAGVVFAKKIKEYLRAQLSRFRELVGRDPDHIDSHYRVHTLPRIYPQFVSFSEETGIPVREVGGVKLIDSFFGKNEITDVAEWEMISVASLLGILRELPDGTSELMCHPGYVTPDLKSLYSKQREVELKTLTDPRIKTSIREQGIELTNFSRDI